jgi:hypothetical protein
VIKACLSLSISLSFAPLPLGVFALTAVSRFIVYDLGFQLAVQTITLADLGVESDHLESHQFDYSGLLIFNYWKGRSIGCRMGKENSREETQKAHKSNSF